MNWLARYAPLCVAYKRATPARASPGTLSQRHERALPTTVTRYRDRGIVGGRSWRFGT